MPSIEVENYIQRNWSKISKKENKLLNCLKSLLLPKYDENKVANILTLIGDDFETLLPNMPYIGGEKNYWSSIIPGITLCLSAYRILHKEGLSDEEIGKMVYETEEKYLESKSRFQKFMGKWEYTGFLGKYYLKRLAKKSHESKYESDIVFDYIKGDGEVLYELRFTKCPLKEFYAKYGAEKFAPFICLTDYATASKLNYNVKRTHAISIGDNYCDFKVLKGNSEITKWDPEKFDEYQRWIKLDTLNE